MVVTGKFRKAPDPSCPNFTVANIHINQRVRQEAVCVHCVVAPRPRHVPAAKVVLTGDFNKGAEREALSGDSGDQRRISPLDAAFGYACVPWPASGVTPLWGPGGEPHGKVWPECCGFVILPDSQNQCLITRHDSFNVKPAAIGLKPTDQTWHHEQWLHLKVCWPHTQKGRFPFRFGFPVSQVFRTSMLRVTGVTPGGGFCNWCALGAPAVSPEQPLSCHPRGDLSIRSGPHLRIRAADVRRSSNPVTPVALVTDQMFVLVPFLSRLFFPSSRLHCCEIIFIPLQKKRS